MAALAKPTRNLDGHHAFRSRTQRGEFRRWCGPKALTYLLHERGEAPPLEELWSMVRAPDPFGSEAGRLSRLAFALQHLGWNAVAIQCLPDRAWEALIHCHRTGWRVILNHQAPWAEREGHYSNLVDIDAEGLHRFDATIGRIESHSKAEWNELWHANTETVGFAMVVAAEPSETDRCPIRFDCPICGDRQTLAPAWLFTPTDPTEIGPTAKLFCGNCDAAFKPRGSKEPIQNP